MIIKTFLFLFLFVPVVGNGQITEALRFRLTIDSCVLEKNVLNKAEKEFYIIVKNSSEIMPLFMKGTKEVAIKLYVNQVTEDEKPLTIVKYVFLEKKGNAWEKLNNGDYSTADYSTLRKSLRVGDKLDGFYVSFSLYLDPDFPANVNQVPVFIPMDN